MPLVTIVVPVYAVQGYLRECLDSILGQSYADFELIAVDDHSPDHCGAILDEYAAREPRMQVIHLDTNVGLGPARNVGLARATGEYVWFIDSDDWIATGSLRAIAAKLSQTSPDILMISHNRTNLHGRPLPRRGDIEYLRGLDGPCFTLADQPGLTRLHTVAWNKVVRRQFLLEHEIQFPPGWYEDLPFTYPVLVAAQRIAALGRVCYHYRQRRKGAITRTEHKRHLEVFDQWARVFAQLDRIGERAAPFRGVIFDRMIWHYLVVQAAQQRVPRQFHRVFFRRLAEHYRRFRPADHTPPPAQVDRLRRRLIAADAYRTYRAFRLVRLATDAIRRRTRSGLRVGQRAARSVVDWVAARFRLTYYRLQRRLPLDRDLAVYAAYWYRGYSCNPAAIYEKARELVPSVHGVWVVRRGRHEDLPPGVPYVVEGSLQYYRALARATWLINNVNFPNHVIKRSGSVHLQTHHGTPVKVMGIEQAAYPIGAKDMDFDALLHRCDRWDFSLTANAHSTEVWDRAYPCHYQTLEYGYPRNDRLANATAEDSAAARAALGIEPGRTVVLYAPTHREYLDDGRPLLDLEQLAEALGPQFLLLWRAHYFYDSVGDVRHPHVADVSAYPCVEDVLLAADILVTDYSSIMFDFTVLDRPIALFTPDWDAYRRTRGVTFDLLTEPPGIVTTNQADLADAFRTGAVISDAANKLRAHFRTRFCYLDDGHAAERVVRHLFAEAPRG